MSALRQLALVLLFPLAIVQAAFGHDEPPKTVSEKAEQRRARDRFSSLDIRQQDVWIVKPGESGGVSDSSLRLTNKYDRAGNLTEQTVYDTSGAERSRCVYDDRGLWLEELSYDGDSLVDRTVFVYGRYDLIAGIVSYDCAGQVTGRLDYLYSSADLTIRVTKLGVSDTLQYTILYTYEPGRSFERMLEAIQTGANGGIRTRARNEYADGKRLRKLVYGPDSELRYSFSYMYTPEGDFSVITKMAPDGGVVFTQNYRYSEQGLLESVCEMDETGSIVRTWRYSYAYFNASE